MKLHIGNILKSGISGIANPYSPGISTGNRVLAALDRIFTSQGIIFEGLVSDHVSPALAAGISETEIHSDLSELEREGWIIISGDTLTPLDPLINRYS